MWPWQKCNSALHFCISKYVSFEVAATWRAKWNRALSITATACSSNSLYSSDLNGVSNCWVLICSISAMVFVVGWLCHEGRKFGHQRWHNSPFYKIGCKGTKNIWDMQINLYFWSRNTILMLDGYFGSGRGEVEHVENDRFGTSVLTSMDRADHFDQGFAFMERFLCSILANDS